MTLSKFITILTRNSGPGGVCVCVAYNIKFGSDFWVSKWRLHKLGVMKTHFQMQQAHT